MRKYFYVLELQDRHFYVGISSNTHRRFDQHSQGNGAVWTKMHPPVGILFQHEHEVIDYRAAELIENEITVRLMIEHGWQRVRGGFFCNADEAQLEQALRAHGHRDRVVRASLGDVAPASNWTEALDAVLRLAIAYHDGDWSIGARDALLAEFMGLTKHQHWRPDLDAGLDKRYWGKKGILRGLRTFQQGRMVGYKLQATSCKMPSLCFTAACRWAPQAFSPGVTATSLHGRRSARLRRRFRRRESKATWLMPRTASAYSDAVEQLIQPRVHAIHCS